MANECIREGVVALLIRWRSKVNCTSMRLTPSAVTFAADSRCLPEDPPLSHTT